MTKRDRSIFLPQVVDAWGGIDYWVSGDRSAMRRSGFKYPLWGDASRPMHICRWIIRRIAKGGKTSVRDANKLLMRVAYRYSGSPERTYEAARFEGMGCLIGRGDQVGPSLRFWTAVEQSSRALEEAQADKRAHSDAGTRMLWLVGGDKYETLKPCRWCGETVNFKEHWKKHDGSVRCNRRDCRRMEYLQHTPQSRGGIDLTPRQRQGLNWEAWNTQKTINYLALVAKEIKRANRSANHDVR